VTANSLAHATQLSPLRHSTTALTHEALVEEQLVHFGIDPASEHGRALWDLVTALGASNAAAHELWALMTAKLASLSRTDRIAWFNAKRFACFQLAKVLDTLQNPLRATYQSLVDDCSVVGAKGPYPLFDNVGALFSATPVITRTATYAYACTEWIEDAFQGKEFLHQIYSRLLNPTSICLANHIVDLETGPEAADYFAWNFNSGMAAIDATLSHLLGQGDIVLASRHVYGGTHQLLVDWYGRRSNLDIAIEWFDGEGVDGFGQALRRTEAEWQRRTAIGRQIFVYLESPCNPQGYVLDVPGICRLAHEKGLTVICDSTVATPFLQPTLKRADKSERPDFVIHSYTKDLCGSGNAVAGVVIARKERMFLPKGQSVRVAGHDGRERECTWDQTMFWNVYYIKGAFLDSDKAFEVLTGMKTAELRIIAKCISTIVLAKALDRHSRINVSCSVVDDHPNSAYRNGLMTLGLPAPLFTIDFEPTEAGQSRLEPAALKRFVDNLEPAFGLQVSLGQTNTTVLCPGLTSHSELSVQAMADAGITPTTIRISVGDEDPRFLFGHMADAAQLAFGGSDPDIAAGFPPAQEVSELYRDVYLDVHRRWVERRCAEVKKTGNRPTR
jgi:O-acetylhomoserine/O-acetylserine sulfhydrylase-like pyridoxal-dependent enzyme